jgi:transposase
MEQLIAAALSLRTEPTQNVVFLRYLYLINKRENDLLPNNRAGMYSEDKKATRTRIQFLSRNGLKTPAIAAILKTSKKTATKWAKRSNQEDATRSGRPSRALSPDTKSRITDICKDQWNSSVRNTAKQLNLSDDFVNRNKTISCTTVCRYIRSTEWGRVAYKAKIAPMLTAKNVQDRLSFSRMIVAGGYCEGTQEATIKLNNILFTDESWVELFPRPNPQNTRIRSADSSLRVPTRIPKHGLKIMVAGGLCASGLTDLHVATADVTITGNYYRSHILPVFFSSTDREGRLFDRPREIVFMQDGAPAHTAHATLDVLRQRYQTIWSRGVWPGNSPDLNPIEHLWSLLQQSVFIEPRPRNREQLIDRVQHSWSSIGCDLTKRLIYSFPRRIVQCLERQGGSTDY